MIKNIFFDMGGVLLDLDINATVRAFERLGVDVSDYLGRSLQKGFVHQYEVGEISTAEFRDNIRRMTGQSLTDAQIDDAWNSMIVCITERRVKYLIELNTTYNVFLLSNINDLHWHRCREMIEAHGVRIEDCFVQTFCSHELHCSKPDAQIFLRSLELAHALPDETLFIDDSEANCRQAAQLGINIMHMEHPLFFGGSDFTLPFPSVRK